MEVVVDARGLPLGMAIAAANVSEQALLVPALDDVPVEVPEGTPVVADKGHDSDPLRDDVEAAGFVPVIPHRNNRVKPCMGSLLADRGRRLPRATGRAILAAKRCQSLTVVRQRLNASCAPPARATAAISA